MNVWTKCSNKVVEILQFEPKTKNLLTDNREKSQDHKLIRIHPLDPAVFTPQCTAVHPRLDKMSRDFIQNQK